MRKNFKTVIFASVATIFVLALGACSGKQACSKGTCSLGTDDEDKVYTGVLPGADTDGIRYTLKLDYDDDNNKEGDYKLIETYLTTDSLSKTGYRDFKSFKSEGDFTVLNKNGKDYLKLVQDRNDSSVESNAGPIYFLVASDSTLTLVGEDLQEAVMPGVNYTLKIVR